MEESKKITQVVFLGIYRDKSDRVKYLLRKFIPHKVYFMKGEENLIPANWREVIENTKKEYEKELPKWVVDESEEVEVPYYDFSKAFPIFLKIFLEEKKSGNNVYVNLQGSSHIASLAAAMAASLAGAKVFAVIPTKYEIVDGGKDVKSVGAKDHVEVKIPIIPQLPKKEGGEILKFLLKHDGNFRGKLYDIVSNIGLDRLGANIKKPNSGVVKVSKTISKLREDGYLTTKKISRKTFQITLTEKGRLLGEIVNLLKN